MFKDWWNFLDKKIFVNKVEIYACVGIGSGIIGVEFGFFTGLATCLLVWAICLSILTTIGRR